MSPVISEDASVIAELNDQFRKTFQGGRIVHTQGVDALPHAEKLKLFQAVRDFSIFKPESDPYGEHDFGAAIVANTRYFFKIDYYDLNLEYKSENPADTTLTQRVLTIMRADEY